MNKLKTSCFLSVDRDLDAVLKSVEQLKNEGFDAVEPISLRNFWDDSVAIYNAEKIKEKVLELGMSVSCYSLAVNMLSDPNARALLKKTTDLAAAMGAPYLHHTMEGKMTHIGLPAYQSVEPTFVEMSREAAEYAGEKGIACIYEDQGFLINTPDRLDSLIAKVNMPNTGVCLDVGNSLFYDIPAEEYTARFAGIIKNVHIKDYLYKTTPPGADKWRRTIHGNYLNDCPIGYGAVNFDRIFSLLVKAGYDGYFSLEGTGHHDRAKGVQLAMDAMKYYYDKAVSENI